MPVKVICCGCGIHLKDTPAEVFDDDYFTIGLCESCAHHFMAMAGMGLAEYLEGLAVPTVVVARDGTISCANRPALDLLGKPPESIQGAKGGDIFECDYARLPGGCGETVHCSGCTIRNMVLDTMKTGIAHDKVRAYLKRAAPGDTPQFAKLLVSTEKKGNIVFLKIEEISEVKENR